MRNVAAKIHAGARIRLGSQAVSEMRELCMAAFAGQIPILHETILIAGYRASTSCNVAVAAELANTNSRTLRRIADQDQKFPYSVADQAFEWEQVRSLIEPGAVEMFVAAFEGRAPEIDQVVIESGYWRGWMVPLAVACELLGVDERTLYRKMTDGLPFTTKDGKRWIDLPTAIAWMRGVPEHEFSPQGNEVARQREEILSREADTRTRARPRGRIA